MHFCCDFKVYCSTKCNAVPHTDQGTTITVTDEDQHTTLPHVSQTPAASVISGGVATFVLVTSTQAPTTNEEVTLSVLAGAVFGDAILLTMIVSTLVVILIVKIKKTREKAGHSVSSCTGLSKNMCIVYCSAYNDCSLSISCVGGYSNTPGLDRHLHLGKEHVPQ